MILSHRHSFERETVILTIAALLSAPLKSGMGSSSRSETLVSSDFSLGARLVKHAAEFKKNPGCR